MDALESLSTNPRLLAALKKAASYAQTPAEAHAQRRSWVIGQMMCSHPEMTREEAEAHADKALGPNLAARVAELEAENARLRTALHDAICRPLGVTPDSALDFYSPRMADEAEARRPRLPNRPRHTVPVGIAVDADQSRPPIPASNARIAKARRARPAPGTREEG